jgi:hypothetical protein
LIKSNYLIDFSFLYILFFLGIICIILFLHFLLYLIELLNIGLKLSFFQFASFFKFCFYRQSFFFFFNFLKTIKKNLIHLNFQIKIFFIGKKFIEFFLIEKKNPNLSEIFLFFKSKNYI